jgi:hypothetical protein
MMKIGQQIYSQGWAETPTDGVVDGEVEKDDEGKTSTRV